jgi:putative transposase
MHRNKNGYYYNRHSSFLLQYHLVLVTKYRHPVITGKLEAYLLDYTKRYFKERGLPVIAVETMPDHIHILFEAPPQLTLSDFVNALKSASSRRIRAEFAEELKPYYWKPYFWSPSYFIATVSERSTEAVKHYILTQKE